MPDPDKSTLKQEFNDKSGADPAAKYDRVQKIANHNEVRAARVYDRQERREGRDPEAEGNPRDIRPHNVNRMVLESYKNNNQDYEGKSVDARVRYAEKRIKNGLGPDYQQNAAYDERVAKDLETLDKLNLKDNKRGHDVLNTINYSFKDDMRPVKTVEQMEGDGAYARQLVEDGYDPKNHTVTLDGYADGSGALRIDLDGSADDPHYIKHQIEANPDAGQSPYAFVNQDFDQKRALNVNPETGEASYQNTQKYGEDGYKTTSEFKQVLADKAQKAVEIEKSVAEPSAQPAPAGGSDPDVMKNSGP